MSGGETKLILSGKYGADYLWSPDGSQVLVSATTDSKNNKMTLGIVNSNGEYRSLNIPTFVSKCVWSKDGKTIFYALPGEIPDSAILPNDYQDKKFFTDDTFWKMDTATGKSERTINVSDIQGNHDSEDLFLSSDENMLFFINRIDGKLCRIDME
jgi:Tol biopolymer transport system component